MVRFNEFFIWNCFKFFSLLFILQIPFCHFELSSKTMHASVYACKANVILRCMFIDAFCFCTKRNSRGNIVLRIDVFLPTPIRTVWYFQTLEVNSTRFRGQEVGFHVSNLPRQFCAWILNYLKYMNVVDIQFNPVLWFSMNFKNNKQTCFVSSSFEALNAAQ